ncbi:hypothetical protein Pelo_10087 [Pelomyxa schiedti]|nr:hypothetical protein Pelo_10087 [Pelomyxa schiedti]
MSPFRKTTHRENGELFLDTPSRRKKRAPSVATALRVAEAFFPLVGPVCRCLLRTHEHFHAVLDAAAAAGCMLCVGWLVTHHRRRRRKDFIRVLGGLCAGGHLRPAEGLVAGRFAWLVWPGEQGELAAQVRDCRALRRACEGGRLDAAAWVAGSFGITEAWELYGPFLAAVSGGHLEVAKWIVGSLGVIKQFRKYNGAVHERACESGNLELFKWCCEKFHVANNRRLTLLHCIFQGRSAESTQICRYIVEHFRLSSMGTPVFKVNRLDVLLWLTDRFSCTLTNSIVILALMGEGGPGMAKWICGTQNATDLPFKLYITCKNPSGDVELVKFMLTEVNQGDLQLRHALMCFLCAVESGNISVA